MFGAHQVMSLSLHTFGQSYSLMPASTSHSARSTLIFSSPTSLRAGAFSSTASEGAALLSLFQLHMFVLQQAQGHDAAIASQLLARSPPPACCASAHLMAYCSIRSETVTMGHLIFSTGLSSSSVNRCWWRDLYSVGKHLQQ